MTEKKGNESNSSFNLQYLNEVADGNQEFIKEMIDIFLEDMPKFMQEIVDCSKKDDLECMERLAHKSKSMAGYIMADDLQNKFKKLEAMTSNNSADTDDIHALVSDLDRRTENIIDQLKNHFQ